MPTWADVVDVRAGDGWILRYAPGDECSTIYAIGGDGVCKYIWSGDVGGAFLVKEKRRFLRDHAEQQMALC